MLFSKIDVNKVEWLNLVFENRNQSYGAYVLRRDSGNYLFKSLVITGCLFGGAVLLSSINRKIEVDDPIVAVTPLINPDEIHVLPIETLQPKPKLANPIISPPSTAPATDAQQINFSGKLNPVRDNATVAEIPTIKQIEESVIGLQEKDGLKSVGTNSGTGVNGDVIGGSVTDGKEIYTTNFLEVMPEFPGGMKAWANFLTKNLHYPVIAMESGISGKVLVSFVVERNGEISNLKVVKGIGGGCDEEAMRVIKKSPFWKPGMQNGRAVRVAYLMPVVFRSE